MNSSKAKRAAIELVTSALQSGSIKLLGVANASSSAKSGEADATYLATLINTLAVNLESAEEE